MTTTLQATELEAGDSILRKNSNGGTYSIRLSYVGLHDIEQVQEGDWKPEAATDKVIAWEGISQFGTPRHGILAPTDTVEVTSR